MAVKRSANKAARSFYIFAGYAETPLLNFCFTGPCNWLLPFNLVGKLGRRRAWPENNFGNLSRHLEERWVAPDSYLTTLCPFPVTDGCNSESSVSSYFTQCGVNRTLLTLINAPLSQLGASICNVAVTFVHERICPKIIG